MGYHNLGYYSLSYEKCRDSLARMKNGQRWIANNTTLYAAESDRGDVGEPCFKVRLHTTPILTFYQDGAIRIRTEGWGNNPTTRDRLRNYLPGNMTIRWGGLRTITRPHMLIMKTDDGRTVSRPLGSDRVFRPDGCAEDLALMNERDAFDVWELLLEYEKKFLRSFLRGDMNEPTGKIIMPSTHYALKLLDTMELTVELLPSGGHHRVFFKEYYKKLSPTKPKLPDDELAEWMERSMDGGRMRPARGTDQYRAVSYDVLRILRCYFLASLMFEED